MKNLKYFLFEPERKKNKTYRLMTNNIFYFFSEISLHREKKKKKTQAYAILTRI